MIKKEEGVVFSPLLEQLFTDIFSSQGKELQDLVEIPQQRSNVLAEMLKAG